jgi:ParB-like chromosome segregation protein Spo0J
LEVRKKEFEAGAVPPIVLMNNIVVDGVQRFETAKLLGYTEIDAIPLLEVKWL